MESLERLGGVATRHADRGHGPHPRRPGARGRRHRRPRKRPLRAAGGRRVSSGRPSTHGAVSWRSAAQCWGWVLLRAPDQPEVTVPRNRKMTSAQRAGVTVHVADLHSSEIDDGVATKARTLSDCLRGLPFDEALAVADSAARHGFSPRLLKGLAAARAPRLGPVPAVARIATADAVNPFESGLRAIADGVAGLHVRPQVSIDDPHFLGRPDLVDERLGSIPRPTRSSGTGAGLPYEETPSATTSSWCVAGWCCGSPGRRHARPALGVLNARGRCSERESALRGPAGPPEMGCAEAFGTSGYGWASLYGLSADRGSGWGSPRRARRPRAAPPQRRRLLRRRVLDEGAAECP